MVGKSRSHSQGQRKALNSGEIEAMCELFALLSDPTRIRILQNLRNGDASVSELVKRLGMKQSNISKQLGVLHRSGILARRKLGLEVRYRVVNHKIYKLCGLCCDTFCCCMEERVRLFR